MMTQVKKLSVVNAKVYILSIIVLLVFLSLLSNSFASEDVREAIVKVYTVSNSPDYYNPWSMQGPRASSGSGCMIEGNLILTNAHVVGNQTFLQVRKYGDTQRFTARVVAVSHLTDLALLTVDDEQFFEGEPALSLGELPETQQEVLVYGFPMGGDMLSITKGVISRIEHQPYVHSSSVFLAGQIDAAINPGNSGGPVLVEDKIVGVVMAGIPSAQNIGYMVPVPVIR
ncbi:MAG: serine protease, partial [Candidatus Caldatribacteriota bacterium]